MTTPRPIALAAAVLLAAPPAEAGGDDHRRPDPRGDWIAPPPAVAVAVSLPPFPRWLALVAPPPPAAAPWTPRAVALHHRWLDVARAAFYARGVATPWRIARFEAWHRAYRAGLDHQWTLVARAAPPGWRGGRRGHGSGG
jgi:hypothetical protein